MYNQVINLEGIDKSGKTTLLKYIVKETKGKYLVNDRSYLSQIAYGRIFKRNINEAYFWQRFMRANLACDEKFIYLECDDDYLVSRLVRTNEKDITPYDIYNHKKIFEEVIKEAKDIYDISVIKINNTFQTVEDTYLYLQTLILNDEIQYCNQCVFCSREVNKRNFEKGYGKLIPRISAIKPKYLIVGINPSNKRLSNSEYPFDINEENQKNKVFIDILKKYDILGQSVITNAVKCSSDTNKIIKKDYEACKHHLETELELFKPRYIICLGNTVKELLSSSNSFKDREFITIYHPAYQYAHNSITAEEYDKHIYEAIKHTL